MVCILQVNTQENTEYASIKVQLTFSTRAEKLKQMQYLKLLLNLKFI